MGPLASPTARRTALEQGVDIKDVRGSGDRGRITRDDVMRAVPEVSRASANRQPELLMGDVPPRTEPP